MPLIQGQIVKIHGWMTMSEFTDLITISQMTPGPIAVNSATFVGLRVAGYVGAVVARMYTSFMYHSHSHSKTLSEIPQTGHPSGTARRNKTCGCGDDRISGCFDICHGGLVWD